MGKAKSDEGKADPSCLGVKAPEGDLRAVSVADPDQCCDAHGIDQPDGCERDGDKQHRSGGADLAAGNPEPDRGESNDQPQPLEAGAAMSDIDHASACADDSQCGIGPQGGNGGMENGRNQAKGIGLQDRAEAMGWRIPEVLEGVAQFDG